MEINCFSFLLMPPFSQVFKFWKIPLLCHSQYIKRLITSDFFSLDVSGILGAISQLTQHFQEILIYMVAKDKVWNSILCKNYETLSNHNLIYWTLPPPSSLLCYWNPQKHRKYDLYFNKMKFLISITNIQSIYLHKSTQQYSIYLFTQIQTQNIFISKCSL